MANGRGPPGRTPASEACESSLVAILFEVNEARRLGIDIRTTVAAVSNPVRILLEARCPQADRGRLNCGAFVSGDGKDAPSCGGLSDERPSDVLGALPRRRPHRRSDKRAAPAGAKRTAPTSQAHWNARQARRRRRAPRGARPAQATPKAPATEARPTPLRAERLRQPSQPAGVPPTPPRAGRPDDQTTGRDILGIAAQAAAELAEIGLSVSARALRNAVGRLPRP